MKAAAAVSAARTAVLGCDGGLSGWHPVALAAEVGRAALERAGISAADLDEIVVGCADPVGANGADAARAVVLAAGWPHWIGGHVIDRGETSGIAAIQAAAASIVAGQAESVMVVGLGLSSVVPPGSTAADRTYGLPWRGTSGALDSQEGLLPAPLLAEQAALQAGISRADLNSVAERSRRRRGAARASAAVVAVAERARRNKRTTSNREARGTRGTRGARKEVKRTTHHFVSEDDIRQWGDPAALPPMFHEDGLLTAATFASPADAVTVVLLSAIRSEDAAVTPSAVLVGSGRSAGEPTDPTGGAAQAVRQALDDADIGMGDVSGIAAVEPDAATVLLLARSLEVEPERINPGGGALATGNAGAAEELRLVADSFSDSFDRGRRTGRWLASRERAADQPTERRPASPATKRHRLEPEPAETPNLTPKPLGRTRHLLVISAGTTGSAASVWQDALIPASTATAESAALLS